jgi:hypothetical protein
MGSDHYPLYRRRDNGNTYSKFVMIKGQRIRYTFDNRMVVPYNKLILLKYGAHVNVEFVNSLRVLKYLFKYIYGCI